MRENYFNIVVKKILKEKWKIIWPEKIKKIVQNVLAENYSDQKNYKVVYYLKARWYLLSLKKDVYFIKEKEDNITNADLIEKYYWTILKKHCESYLGKSRYIGGIKALELNMSNFDIPDTIDIINPLKQSKEVVLKDRSVVFKKYSMKNWDLFKKTKKFLQKSKVWNTVFLISNLELSILESLYNPDILSEKYINEIIKKIIRKYKKTLNIDQIIDIIMLGKHHSSINRFHQLAKAVDPDFADKLWEIIKKHSFFVDIK